MSDFISRRSFLKGGMTGAAGLAALGMLSGCSGSRPQALTPLRMAFVHRVAPLTPSTPSALPFATMLWQYCSIGEARRVK